MDGYEDEADWSVVSSQSWIFLTFSEKTYDSCFQRRGKRTSSVAFIDGNECHQFEANPEFT